MLRIRRANDRGHFIHGWLDTYHTFSFADYYDPANMSFRALRVMNEDRVAPGQGFGMHGHRDMEIVTYVLEGALEHRDSLGTGEVLRPGEFQRMSAGTGIRHSEFNPSPTDAVHLYQIWLLPERQGLEPSYEQKAIDLSESRGRLRVVASRDGPRRLIDHSHRRGDLPGPSSRTKRLCITTLRRAARLVAGSSGFGRGQRRAA